MIYDLTNHEGRESYLFFQRDGEDAKRHGAVCRIIICLDQDNKGYTSSACND